MPSRKLCSDRLPANKVPRACSSPPVCSEWTPGRSRCAWALKKTARSRHRYTRNPATVHANTDTGATVAALRSSASGRRSKKATATTAPALNPKIHCSVRATRSAKSPPAKVAPNAARAIPSSMGDPQRESNPVSGVLRGSCQPTSVTHAFDFDIGGIRDKSGRADPAGEQSADRRIAQFGHAVAGPAHQELRGMIGARSFASKVRIERVYPVHESRTDQEVQRPIDRGRRTAETFLGELVQDVIGTDGCVTLPYELQHAQTQGSEFQSPLLADLGCGSHRPRDTSLMLMRAAKLRKPLRLCLGSLHVNCTSPKMIIELTTVIDKVGDCECVWWLSGISMLALTYTPAPAANAIIILKNPGLIEIEAVMVRNAASIRAATAERATGCCASPRLAAAADGDSAGDSCSSTVTATSAVALSDVWLAVPIATPAALRRMAVSTKAPRGERCRPKSNQVRSTSRATMKPNPRNDRTVSGPAGAVRLLRACASRINKDVPSSAPDFKPDIKCRGSRHGAGCNRATSMSSAATGTATKIATIRPLTRSSSLVLA